MSTKKSSQKYDLRTLHIKKYGSLLIPAREQMGEVIYGGWIMDVELIFRINKLETFMFVALSVLSCN